ncbi:MAG TPA: tetratricopeptide repeat protein [Bacteroidales bacterium]|nr:tetratricopeptide repeat protein [Bacteroidales bacterium]
MDKTKKKQTSPIKQPQKETRGVFRHRKIITVSLSVIVLCVITVMVFQPGFKAGFTNWDDPDYVLSNTCIHSLSADHIRIMFTDAVVFNYHPLTLLSLAIDFSRAGINSATGMPDPYPFHQTNIILHILNTLLAFLLIFKLSGRKIFVAFFTAFLFAVHPVHVESVAWISERKDVLYAFFFLISLLFYLRYAENNEALAYGLSLLFFILSLLSKPAAAPAGLILFLMDYYRGRIKLPGFRVSEHLKLIVEKLPFILFGLAILLLTFNIQQKSDTVADFRFFSVPQRIFISFYGFYMYLQKLLIPINLSAFYPYPIKDIHDGIPVSFYITFIMSLLILALTFISVKKTRVVFFGILFYLFMLLPVLQFVSVGSSIISERYTYVPYIGIFFMAGMGLHHLWNSRKKIMHKLHIPLIIIIVAYLTVMAVLAESRTHVWHNSETLWTNVLEQFPDLPAAYKNRGNYYASEANQADKALSDYEKFLKLDSTDASAYSNLGNIYSMKEEYQKAISVYSKSVFLDSISQKPPLTTSYSFNNYSNRGFSYLKTGRYVQALKDYSLLLQRFPDDEKLHFNRGLALANTGSYNEAVADFLDCLRLDADSPNHSATLYNLSSCYFMLGDFTRASDFLLQARSAGYPVDDAYFKHVQNRAGIK